MSTDESTGQKPTDDAPDGTHYCPSCGQFRPSQTFAQHVRRCAAPDVTEASDP